MHYRRDIDGLRAVAVASVVLYHAGMPGIPGGFIGVDIFFVISGFLITALTVREIDAGTFSILGFYERRVRRIFPALFAMLLASSLVAWVILLPAELADFGRSLASATLFVSNMFFWRTADYFAGPAHLKPLLHTWSLSVEEQFYILFPPALLVIRRWLGGRYAGWLTAAALASLALSGWSIVEHPVATFYLAPTRAWELLIGALLALGAVRPPQHGGLREAGAWAGAALILYAVTTFNEATAFPGINALIPCLGAALVIWAGSGGPSLVGRLLCTGPMVAVGLLSYSLYLWHWPALALARLWTAGPLTPAAATAAVLVALAASIASWRWIERPFRSRSLVPRRPGLFRMAAAAMVAAVAFGAASHSADGFRARWPGYDPPSIPGREAMREGTCFLASGQRPADYAGPDRCRIGPAGSRRVLLWGDSFAAHIVPGLEAAHDGDLAVVQYTASGCPPILGATVANRPLCGAFNERALALIDELRPATVVLSARWQAYTGLPAGYERLQATVRRIRSLGAEVVLVGQSPSFDFDSPYDFQFRKGGAAATVAVDLGLNRRLRQLSGVVFVDPTAGLCDGMRCPLRQDGAYLYFDGGHYSLAGSTRFAKQLLPILRQMTGSLSQAQ